MKITGPRLLEKEWQIFYPNTDLANAQKIPAMIASEAGWICQRCGSLSQERVPAGFYYCGECLMLGRIDNRSFLYYFAAGPVLPRKVALVWQGELSPAQKNIAEALVKDQANAETFLLWAVTGAGKTEILFPLLKASLEQGQKIAVTSPRVDVCNELYLRFCQAFPQEQISLLHGQERKDAGGDFIICTIHQLFRYYDHFDLVIVDEVDAFPYAGNPLLHRAVDRAQRTGGKRLYLSATPDEKLKQDVDRTYYLPARYHRRSLPIPQLLLVWGLERDLRSGRLSKKILSKLRELLGYNDVLFFCPNISLLEKLAGFLQQSFPEIQLTTVFSQDQERLMKVENMREGRYQLLLTTTILERGVTFEQVSVVILQASHQVFNKAALVQIAGRADRKGAYSHAEVIFITSEVTTPIKEAIREIKKNNQRALQEGLIDAL